MKIEKVTTKKTTNSADLLEDPTSAVCKESAGADSDDVEMTQSGFSIASSRRDGD